MLKALWCDKGVWLNFKGVLCICYVIYLLIVIHVLSYENCVDEKYVALHQMAN